MNNYRDLTLTLKFYFQMPYLKILFSILFLKGGNYMELLWGLLAMLGVLILGTYFLNKLSTRKVNSFDKNVNNTLSEIQQNDNQPGPGV